MSAIDTMRVHISKHFSFLWEEPGFSKSSEEYDESYYEVRFQKSDMAIRLENYRREFYLYLSKPSRPEDEFNLFNLVDFLEQNTKEKTRSNYFRNVRDLGECYGMQIEWLGKVLRKFLPEVHNLLSDGVYSRNIPALDDYLVKKHPDLYGKHQ